MTTPHVVELGTANGELWSQMEAEMMVGGKVKLKVVLFTRSRGL